MSKTLHRNLQAKMDALQGPEWDSSDEEAGEILTKATKKQKKTVPKETKSAKGGKKAKTDKMELAKDEREQDATVLYIGHLPIEFEELDLKNFLQQFGKVVNIRISRSVKTGNSRGYAFVGWEDAETARIVADTLQGYFVGQRRLICHTIPNPPKNMFYNTDSAIQRRKLQQKADQQKRNRDLASMGKMKEITARLIQREQKKRAKLAALGIDYDFPGYEANQMEVDIDSDAAAAVVPVKGDDATSKDAVEKQEDVKASTSDKKKKRRKESIDSVASASSSASSRKRKDSVGSESSATKKSKRKDSVGSEASAGSSATKKQKKEPNDSVGRESSATKKKDANVDKATPMKEKSNEPVVQSEKKNKNTKKSKKRRQSAP